MIHLQEHCKADCTVRQKRVVMKKYNPSTTSKSISITFRCPKELKIKIDNEINKLNQNERAKITQTDWIVSILKGEIEKDQKDLD